MTRGRYGHGSVYQREDDRWVAAVSLPPGDNGERRRKRFVRTTREEAQAALDAWMLDHPRPAPSPGRNAHMDAARCIATHTAQEWRTKVRSYAGMCHYCGRPWGASLHKDHLVPVSRGGSDGIDNVVPSCADCNLSKGTVPADHFIVWARAVGFFDRPQRMVRTGDETLQAAMRLV